MRRLFATSYPAALAVAYVLAQYLNEGVPLVTGLRAAAVAALTAGAVTGLGVVVLADLRRGGLMGAVIVGLLLTIHRPMMGEALSLVALALVVERLLATRRWGNAIHIRVANGLMPVLGAVLLILIVAQFATRGELLLTRPAAAAAFPVAGDPEIWVVLLDGYPRADVLADVYGYEEQALTRGLEGLGFAVSRHSRSNYPETIHTLPSMLNFSLNDEVYPVPHERQRVLQDNRVFGMLRGRGYEVIAFGGGYTHTDLRSADRFIDTGAADLFEIQLLADSGLRYVVDALAPTFATSQVRSRIESNLAGMVELSREPAASPRFVWVHIPAPHAPSVFAADGSTLPASLDGLFFDTEPGGSAADHRKRFAANLAHLDGIVLAAVSEVVAARPENVVVVMSDHGTRSTGEIDILTPADVHERFGILFAARTPGHPGLFEDDITLVNVFPTLFDAYLGTSLPRHPDLLIDTTGTEHPNPDAMRS